MSKYYIGNMSFDSDSLYHYRTRGSRNGVRRYQNEDGSLTPLGRSHYGVGDGPRAHENSNSIKPYAKVYEDTTHRKYVNVGVRKGNNNIGLIVSGPTPSMERRLRYQETRDRRSNEERQAQKHDIEKRSLSEQYEKISRANEEKKRANEFSKDMEIARRLGNDNVLGMAYSAYALGKQAKHKVDDEMDENKKTEYRDSKGIRDAEERRKKRIEKNKEELNKLQKEADKKKKALDETYSRLFKKYRIEQDSKLWYLKFLGNSAVDKTTKKVAADRKVVNDPEYIKIKAEYENMKKKISDLEKGM